MITFLSSPKAFIGLTKANQYRAIMSWFKAVEGAEVILFGDSLGIEEAGLELNATVVKNVDYSLSGVPYFNSVVEYAAKHGKYDLQVYVNCDILMSGILSAMLPVQFDRFLLVGQRIDLARDVSFDCGKVDWKSQLRSLAGNGKISMHQASGKDYFGFRRGLWHDLPPVVLGRGGYDNALMAYCFRKRIPVFDGTFAVTALHQFHDYSHVAGGALTTFKSDDAKKNTAIAGGPHSSILTSDADYVLLGEDVRYCPCRQDKLRHYELLIRFRYGFPRLGLALRGIWRVLQCIGVTRVSEVSLEEFLNSP